MNQTPSLALKRHIVQHKYGPVLIFWGRPMAAICNGVPVMLQHQSGATSSVIAATIDFFIVHGFNGCEVVEHHPDWFRVWYPEFTPTDEWYPGINSEVNK